MHSFVPVPSHSCPAKFLVWGFLELRLPSTGGLPGCDKGCAVLAVHSVMCDSRDVRILQDGLGVEKVRDWEDVQKSGLSSFLCWAQRQTWLLHNTGGTANCAFCKKVGFLISGNCYVISQREEQNIPRFHPHLRFQPPVYSAWSIFDFPELLGEQD